MRRRSRLQSLWRVAFYAALACLLVVAVVPSFAAKGDNDGDADQSASTAYTEDNDTNDNNTPNNQPDEGDNAHPSGKDRSVEHGGSGNQGKAESNPDDSRGPQRYEGQRGDDKPNGPGGTDLADQDGNNGCGNDDDFNDDNNGHCGPRTKPTTPPSGGGGNPCPKGDMNGSAPGCGAVGGNQEDRCPDGAMPAHGKSCNSGDTGGGNPCPHGDMNGSAPGCDSVGGGGTDCPYGQMQNGQSCSTPDQDGKGMDRGSSSPDKSHDGNNGCGNEPRSEGHPGEDDNNGWCGHKPKDSAVLPAQPGVSVPPSVDVNPVTPGVVPDAVLGERIEAAADAGAPSVAPSVLGKVLTAPKPAAKPEVAADGATLPFTGGDVLRFLALALGLILTGAIVMKTVKTQRQ